MTNRTLSEVFIALCAADHGTLIHLHCEGAQAQQWHLADGASEAKTDDVMREVVTACGKAPVVCLDAQQLSSLLSRPNVLPLARQVLGKLRDLRELAMIWLPRESEYTLAALAPDVSAGDLPEALAQTIAIHDRVLEAVEGAPPEMLATLGPLLAQDTGFSWLPWPEGCADPISLLQIGRVLPRRPPQRKRKPADGDTAGDLRDMSAKALSPGGAIEDALPAYEHRAGQVEMAAEVAEALREEKLLLVEAGTGVGKSLAYLVPAILWSLRAGEPVVVSTNTKNLQEQLMQSDLPLLREALSVNFEAALVKGRANYPCIRSLVSAAVDAANSLFRGERLAAAYLISWLANSPRGDLEEIGPQALEAFGELPRLISRVRSQGDACLGRACSHNDCCPVEIARAFARRADVIVSNHALTFADAKASVLPKYSRLIFDEAQNIEAVATDGLSLECSSYGCNQMSRALTGEPSSFVEIMRRRLADMSDDEAAQEATGLLEQIPELADNFAVAVTDFGDALYDFCFAMPSDARAEGDRSAVRLTEAVRETAEWTELASLGETALAQEGKLLGAVEAFAAKLAEIDKGASPGAEGLDGDAEAMRLRIAQAVQSLRAVLEAKGEVTEFVTWAEAWRSRWGPAWSLHAAPVDIGPVLDEALYQHKASIVFTSATITVDDEFSYFRQRLGLDKHHERLAEATVPSPFDLTEQLLLCVPNDMPEPSQAGFNDAVIDALRQILEVTEGGTLALFTARTRMTRAFEQLEDDMRAMDLTPLCQDISGPRSALLARLRSDPRAVLFGLKSFWEGVDVPGEALRCVVICKLPFAVPSDPIIEARQEDVAAKGHNPMLDYYIPEAVIGFKQGFGRLIRTTTDTGVVFVLDRRVLTRGYGRRFFRSIQRCELSREALKDCLAQARGWLGKR